MPESVPVLTPPATCASTYISRPVSITAMRWDGTAESATPIINWAMDHDTSIRYWCGGDEECREEVGAHVLRIPTIEGNMDAAAGWWIIRGTENEFYPCKDSVFQRKYQASTNG